MIDKYIFLTLFLFLFSIIWIFTVWSIDKYGKTSNTENMDKLFSLGDTLDLILFSGDTFGEKAIKWHTSSSYSHIAMIVKEAGILYLVEVDVGQGYRSGTRIIPLKDKIARWKGRKKCLWLRFSGVKPLPVSVLTIANRYIDKDMDVSMVSWAFTELPHIHTLIKPKDKMYCSELIAIILSELNILPLGGKDPSWYSPQSILDDKDIKSHYDQPMELSF